VTAHPAPMDVGAGPAEIVSRLPDSPAEWPPRRGASRVARSAPHAPAASRARRADPEQAALQLAANVVEFCAAPSALRPDGRLRQAQREAALIERTADVVRATSTGRLLPDEAARRLAAGWLAVARRASAGLSGAGLTAEELVGLLLMRIHSAASAAQAAAGGAPGPRTGRDGAPDEEACEWLPSLAVDEKGFTMIRRGPLSVRLEAVAVSWNGRCLGLSPMEARILGLLVRQGTASYEAIDAMMRTANANTRRVFLHRLKRKLADAGAGNLFRTFYAQGISLAPAEAA
jgi:hypothetical protein